ncbi:chromate efflux transporter [Polyangium spumosum]|uniref:Chromate efflux transporter n=1 Tax=Polyangium spumosum TaxID=889282 RepID=A0A6N7PGK6_9BACT|nr:chromate efflux transporter [Polyangium spumosum]MRG91183.1 chromate efflux transporter [Polyangium spumosum]
MNAEATPPPASPDAAEPGRLREVALLFLRLGFTAFGGPAAHVALMEAEVVTRRKWVTREEFLDLFAATNLIPGPNSTEMAIHLGYRRAGTPGLAVAGVCFILPAALVTAAFAIAYMRLRAVPAMEGLLYGLKPAMLAIVLAAMARLVLPRKKDWFFLALGTAAAAASVLGVNEVAVIFAGAGIGALRIRKPPGKPTADEKKGASPALFPVPLLASAAMTTGGSKLIPLGLFFLKVGSILYGSGYVLIALLRAGLVSERGWLTEAELLDAVAIGQFTPGPVLSTATFIGYLIEGPAGAAVATLAIFLPSFLLVRVTAPILPKMRAAPRLAGLLDGAAAASLGLLAAATIALGRGALVDLPAWLILAAALPIAMQPKINATWIVVGSALVGLAVRAAFGHSP